MVELINDCVDCTSIGLHCRGSLCPYNESYYAYYCDVCGERIEEDGLCRYCSEDAESENGDYL